MGREGLNLILFLVLFLGVMIRDEFEAKINLKGELSWN